MRTESASGLVTAAARWCTSLRRPSVRAVLRSVTAVIPESMKVRALPYRKMPVLPEEWEAQYRDGNWRYLDGCGEIAHYSVIVGYYAYLRPGGSVLDVGCGEGVLQERLSPHGYSRYLGLDISKEAIARANARAPSSAKAGDRTQFLEADVENFRLPAGGPRFDVVVFNEVLYYCNDPLQLLRRFARETLTKDGIAIISMHRSTTSLRLWRLIEAAQIVAEDQTTVTNAANQSWLLKVFAAQRLVN
jgi:2-polyprenyl-3-methyl-5-hydroxy-6-metoxy-1,4-benzoquinol methylase